MACADKSCMCAFPFPFIRATFWFTLPVAANNCQTNYLLAVPRRKPMKQGIISLSLSLSVHANFFHTHAHTSKHTRTHLHAYTWPAAILYQCVHTPLSPNDACKMQRQQIFGIFLNGNFFFFFLCAAACCCLADIVAVAVVVVDLFAGNTLHCKHFGIACSVSFSLISQLFLSVGLVPIKMHWL